MNDAFEWVELLGGPRDGERHNLPLGVAVLQFPGRCHRLPETQAEGGCACDGTVTYIYHRCAREGNLQYGGERRTHVRTGRPIE